MASIFKFKKCVLRLKKKKSHLFLVLQFQHEPRLFVLVSVVNLQHCSQQTSQNTEVALPKIFLLLLECLYHRLTTQQTLKSFCTMTFEQQNCMEKIKTKSLEKLTLSITKTL